MDNEESKKDAIAFLRFADRNGYTETKNGKWASVIDREEKTDDELYELYQQSLLKV